MSVRRDIAETLTNTVGGFILSYLVTLFVFPLIGIITNPTTAGLATLIMFFVSNLRLFAFRRMFRAIESKGN